MSRKPKRQAAARSPRRRRNKHGGCLIFVILFVIIFAKTVGCLDLPEMIRYRTSAFCLQDIF